MLIKSYKEFANLVLLKLDRMLTCTFSKFPIITNRAPTINDVYNLNSIWIDSNNCNTYILISIFNGHANWERNDIVAKRIAERNKE